MPLKIQSHVRYRKVKARTGGVSYYPDQLAKIYGAPAGVTGAGQKIAVIELAPCGFVQSDLNAYFGSRGLTVPAVTFVSVDGATNTPGNPNGGDAEVMLDLEMIGAVAPGASLRCYIAPNTDAGFIAAVKQAVADKVNIICICWGAPENQWSAQSRVQMDMAFQSANEAGILVFCASGDSGSTDGESGNNVDYPASSPYVIGCGGTSLTAQISAPYAILSEVVWNDLPNNGASGGGTSGIYSLPSWQANAGVPTGKARGVPDVASCGDPENGINVVVDGQQMVIGGTSAAAPFWSGMAALLNQACGQNIAQLWTTFYSVPGVCRDITSGNNGTYTAKVGYDCCTGMGSPNGVNLLAALTPTPVQAPTPTPVSTPTPITTITLTIPAAGTYSLTISPLATASEHHK